MTKQEEEMFMKKSKVFFDRDILVHIKKKNGSWINGKIDDIRADFIMLNEFKYGLIPVFYAEIFELEKYNSVKLDKEGEE